MSGMWLIRFGVVCMALAIVAAAASFVVIRYSERNLEQRLTKEYGPRGGKKKVSQREGAAEE